MKNKLLTLITLALGLISINSYSQGWMSNSPSTMFTLNTGLTPSPISIGIGLTNPNTTTHIFDNTSDHHLSISGRAPSARFFNGSSWDPVVRGGRIGFSTSSGHFTNTSNPNDFVVQNVSSGNLLFGTGVDAGNNGLERMRITSNGTVGVNTTTPSAVFHTNGTLRHQGLTIDNTLNEVLVVDAAGNVFRNTNILGGANNSWLLGGNNATTLNTGNNILGSNVPGLGVRFNAGSATRMTLTAGGFLGINVANPTAQLHIHSNNPDNHQYITGTAPCTRYFAANNVINPGMNWPGLGGRIGYASNIGDFLQTSVPGDFIVQNFDAVNGGSLILGTGQNGGGNGLERMRIDGLGQIGINNTTPAALLDVQCAGGPGNPSEVRFQGLPNGAGRTLVIDAAGYVYLGPDSPPEENNVKHLEKKIIQLEKKIELLLVSQDINMESTSSSYIKQNVPNPSNSKTKILYSVIENFSSCAIIVTSSTGKKVYEQPIESRGEGQINLDVSSYSPGIYHYSLHIDGKRIDNKKMLVK